MPAPPGKPRPQRSQQDRRASYARQAGGQRPHRRSETTPTDTLTLYGIHAVAAALANPKRHITRLLATENAEQRLADAISARSLAVERVRPKDLDRLLGPDTVHQGIAAEADPLPEPELADLVAAARANGAPLIVLDQVTDPHNVGAILRSAAVFGAAGLVTTRRHSPPLNGTLAKSASGALELIPVALVQNLARSLDDLKEAGVTVVGLDGAAGTLLDDHPLAGVVAFVLGAEGKGLRQLSRETCSSIVRIGTSDTLASLNVSNAAAIALHLASMRRRAS